MTYRSAFEWIENVLPILRDRKWQFPEGVTRMVALAVVGMKEHDAVDEIARLLNGFGRRMNPKWDGSIG